MEALETPIRSSRRRRAYALVWVLLAIVAVGCAPDFEDSTLDTYEIDLLPDFAEVLALLNRPAEPFVMANLLVFRDMAVGEGFEGLTGAEAYQIYVEGLAEAQAELGSRLVWAGAVRNQLVGASDPVFESIGLLEYASPQSFLSFALSPGEAPEARTAGLLGQWLVASTTLEEAPEHPVVPPYFGWDLFLHLFFDGPDCGDSDSDTEWQHGTLSGLSPEQICLLLQEPAGEPVFVVELLRFSDGTGELYEPYREAIVEAGAARGAQLVWRGAYDSFVLGTASPAFEEMVVTRYPSPAAYVATLRSLRVLSASHARDEGLELHWIYTADEVTDGLGF